MVETSPSIPKLCLVCQVLILLSIAALPPYNILALKHGLENIDKKINTRNISNDARKQCLILVRSQPSSWRPREAPSYHLAALNVLRIHCHNAFEHCARLVPLPNGLKCACSTVGSFSPGGRIDRRHYFRRAVGSFHRQRSVSDLEVASGLIAQNCCL